MKLILDQTLAEFQKHTTANLEKEPAVHSFLISMIDRYMGLGKPGVLRARGVSDQGDFLVAGFLTDSIRPLILSKSSEAAASEFAKLLAEQVEKLSGANAPLPAVDSFVETWVKLKKCTPKLDSKMRLFELKAVIPARPTSGFFRAAQIQDEKILFQWTHEFLAESLPNDPRPSETELQNSLRLGIQKAEFFVWEDNGKIVSYLGSARETLREKWVGPVYTPKELRGRGYASALVAEVSQKIVNQGKSGMLFTDLANPTSNSIYQKLGYKPVTDFKYYFFD